MGRLSHRRRWRGCSGRTLFGLCWACPSCRQFHSPSLRRDSRRPPCRRHPISKADCQTASVAHSLGAAVTTRDVNDFEGCGINVINPWADACAQSSLPQPLQAISAICAASGRPEARRASVATGRQFLAPRLLQTLARCAGWRGRYRRERCSKD